MASAPDSDNRLAVTLGRCSRLCTAVRVPLPLFVLTDCVWRLSPSCVHALWLPSALFFQPGRCDAWRGATIGDLEILLQGWRFSTFQQLPTLPLTVATRCTV